MARTKKDLKYWRSRVKVHEERDEANDVTFNRLRGEIESLERRLGENGRRDAQRIEEIIRAHRDRELDLLRTIERIARKLP